MKNQEDLIKIENALAHRQIEVNRAIKSLSKRFLDFQMEDTREELLKKTGERDGLIFALELIWKARQLELL